MYQHIRLRLELLRAWTIAKGVCQPGRFSQHDNEEPRQPNTFPLAKYANLVHPVIPVSAFYEWQTVWTKLLRMVDRSQAMGIQICCS